MRHPFTLFLSLLLLTSANAATREVGAGQTYTTIAAAITASAAGDVINVHNGNYPVAVMVNKSLTIQAAPGEFPILQSVRAGADNVTLRNLEITGWTATSTSNVEGIAQDIHSGLEVDHCTVHAGTGLGSPIDTGNVANGSSANIKVRNSSRTYIHNCDIYGSKKGIKIQSSKSTDGTFANGTRIINNRIHDNPIDGIDFQGSYGTIDGNTIFNNIDINWSTSHPDGIQILPTTTDGQAAVKHLRVTRNTIFNHTQNIFCENQPPETQDVTITDNVVYNDPTAVIHGLLMSNLSAGWGITGGADGITVLRNYAGGASIGISVGGTNAEIKNNMIDRCKTGMRILGGLTTVAAGELDFNTYRGCTSAINWGGSIYATIAAARSAGMPQEAHAISGPAPVNCPFPCIPTPTPTPEPTQTPTPTPTPSPSVSPSPTPEPTPTPTPEPTATPTPEPTATATPTATPEPTPTPTPEPSPTPVPSPTPTATPDPSPTPTPEPTIEPTPIPTPTPTPVSNRAPYVYAGVDRTIFLGSGATLKGYAHDDGFPKPPNLTLTWSQVSGPIAVSFGAPHSLITTVNFHGKPGIYIFKLAASDGKYYRSDKVTITARR